jgi:hypothetical protein
VPALSFPAKLTGSEARQIILKEVRVRREADKTIALAQGLSVYTPALTIDDGEDTLIYLEMVGP